MFVALSVTQRNLNPWGRLLYRHKKPLMHLEPAAYLGRRYAILHVERFGSMDWPQVRRICGLYADRLLCPRDCLPPTDCPLPRPSFPRFTQELLLQTACAIAAQCGLPLYRRVLGLYDPAGAWAPMLFPLLHHYTVIRVVTHATAAYQAAAHRMITELGAPVLVGDDIAALADCALVLCPDTAIDIAHLTCPILLAAPPTQAKAPVHWLVPYAIRPTENLWRQCPPGITPHDFAGALYEFSGLPASAFTVGQLVKNYQIVDFSIAIQAIN